MNKIYYLLLAVVISACQSTQESEDSIVDSTETQIKEKKATTELFAPEDSLYSTEGNQVMVAGYIQHSGLETIQNKAYDEFNAFQLISPKKAFFLLTDESLEKYWGKCVLVKGRFPDGWSLETREHNETFTFDRSALVVDEISVRENICEQISWTNKYHLQQPDTVVRGVLARSSRPSPDIAYDYIIKLDEPVNLLYDDSMTTSEIPVIANMHYKKLEEALRSGKKLQFRGSVAYGYAESMVFHLLEIDSL